MNKKELKIKSLEEAIGDAEKRIGQYVISGGKADDVYIKQQKDFIRICYEKIAIIDKDLEEFIFLVVVAEGYSRDVQIAYSQDAVEDDGSCDWRDFNGEVVVGTYKARTEAGAISQAVGEGYFGDSLIAYKLGD